VGVLGLVVTFSVLMPAPPVMEFWLNEALASAGKPLTLKLTSHSSFMFSDARAGATTLVVIGMSVIALQKRKFALPTKRGIVTMKRIAMMLCVALISGCMIANRVIAASTKQVQLESELMSVWHQRWAALERNDAKAYATFLADDVLVPANGLLYDKRALLNLARNFKETSSEPRDVQVRGYDDAAVMVYRTTVHYPYVDHDITEELRVVETYVKQNQRWLLTARTESEIPNANRVPVKLPPEILDAYVGEYQIAPGKIIKIARNEAKLTEAGPDYPEPEELLPLDESSFYQPEQPGIRTFKRSPHGNVDTYVLWIYDSTITCRKIK
jgi:hypothetical protein